MLSLRGSHTPLSIGLAALLTGCGGKSEGPTCRVSAVAVTPATASVTAGSTTDLSASITQSGCSPAPSVAWSTSDGTIATVSPTGTVSGVSAGSATITASAGGQSGTSSVTVTPAPVASVTVTLPSDTLEVGATATATVVARSASGAALSGRPITWLSTIPTAATVSTSGVVTGVDARLGVTIRATVEGVVGTASLQVLPTREGRRFAFANAHQPAVTTAYAPDSATSFNATGGAISVLRQGTGLYSVLIRRLAKFLPSFRENVFVSAVDVAGEQCVTNSWADPMVQPGATNTDLEVLVECHDPAGDPVDAKFTVLILGSNTLPTPSAFFLVTRPLGVSQGQPPWRFSSAAGAQSSSAPAPGSLLVTLGLPSMAAAGVLVASGEAQAACAPASWTLSPVVVDVRCRDIPGHTARATNVSVAMFERGRTGQRWAFAWSENASPALNVPYTPGAAHQRQSNAQAVAVTRTASGIYSVRFPGLVRTAGGTDIVLVTAVGAATSGWCNVASWGNAGPDLVATVRCRDAMNGGALADQQFAVVLLQ